MIVGLEGIYLLFSFQGEDGKFIGFEVDFVNVLVEYMGVKVKIILIKWDGMLVLLEFKCIDVVIN